jgi:hypothetical protein
VSGPNFSIRLKLKAALKRALSKCEKSVDNIADEINIHLGTKFTGATIYNWTCPSHSKHIPAPEHLITFCYVTNSIEPLRELLNPLNGKVKLINNEQAALLSIIESKETELIAREKQETWWKELEKIKIKYNQISLSLNKEVEQ